MAHRTAFITASYAGDFDRCRLLCETMDRYAQNWTHHHILVSSSDVGLFRSLAGAKRSIIDERDLLPRWIHEIGDPLSGFRRRMWLTPFGPPLRGWHVQQLRRIAVGRVVEDDALVSVDSDVVFVRPYDIEIEWQDDRLRLYAVEGALAAPEMTDQRAWSDQAGTVLGLDSINSHDYINTVIPWRRSTMLAMMERLEAVHGVASFARPLVRSRRLSECMLYGRFATETAETERHWRSSLARCKVMWSKPDEGRIDVAAFLDGLGDGQVAIGLQSFIGVPVDDILRALDRRVAA